MKKALSKAANLIGLKIVIIHSERNFVRYICCVYSVGYIESAIADSDGVLGLTHMSVVLLRQFLKPPYTIHSASIVRSR